MYSKDLILILLCICVGLCNFNCKEPIQWSRSKDAFEISWRQSMIRILVNCWKTQLP